MDVKIAIETLLVVMFALSGFACFNILGKLCECHVYNLGYVLVNSEFTLDLQTNSFFYRFVSVCTVFCLDTNIRRQDDGLLTGKSEGQENSTAVKFS